MLQMDENTERRNTVTLLLPLLKQFGFSEFFSFLPSTLQLTLQPGPVSSRWMGTVTAIPGCWPRRAILMQVPSAANRGV